MSIRRRLTLVLAAVVMSVVAVMAALTWWLAATNLRSSIDDLLRDQADTARNVLGPASEGSFDLPPATGDFGERAFLVQVVASDGDVVGDAELPIDAEVISTVRSTGRNAFRTVDVGERRFRVLAFREGTLVVQLGTDVTSVEDGIGDLRNGVRVAGLLGVALAALMGWLIARRLTKPIIDVSTAAAHLAENSTLPQPIVSDRSDEVGQLAESFNGLLAALRTSREQQARLVGDASHELRTPLTSLRLKIDFLRSQPDLDVDARHRIVEGAAVELEALSALVAELVDLAASTAADEQPERVDLGELVEECAQRARLSSGRSITTSTEHVVVTARPAAIRRAVSNLIGNAHKYSPPDEGIEIHEFAGGIEVRDRGPGIAPDDRDRIFDRFYRAKDTQHIAGSGVGLAIVKQTAELHDGNVWVDAAPGGGAVVGFSVTTEPPE